MIKPPSFPKLTMMAPDGLFISSPGYKVGEQVNGMSAYQNAIIPPQAKEKPDPSIIGMGQTVFNRAQCITCHSGEAYTNHRIVSSQIIGTEPSRALALKKTEFLFGPASIYTPDTGGVD
jgi:mono/diheme cytochrome c family protein